MVDVRLVTVHSYVKLILGFAHALFSIMIAFYYVHHVWRFTIRLAFTLYIFPVIKLLNVSTTYMVVRLKMWLFTLGIALVRW